MEQVEAASLAEALRRAMAAHPGAFREAADRYQRLCESVGKLVAALRPGCEAFVDRLQQSIGKAAAGLEKREDWRGKIGSFVNQAQEFVRSVEAAPASIAYEPLLIGYGLHPLAARLYAYRLKRDGIAHAEELDVGLRLIPKAIRTLAKPGRRTKSIAKTAALINAAPDARAHIRALFADVKRSEAADEFTGLLDGASAADPDACRQLAAIAKEAAVNLQTRRGRRITAASAGHEFFLRLVYALGETAAYTHSAYGEQRSFTDPWSTATKREFDVPRFDPRPALRRFRTDLSNKLTR